MIHYRDIKPNGFVELWDLGPQKPVAPKRPEFKSKQKEGTPEWELDRMEFDEEIRQYKLDFDAYRRLQAEWVHWRDHIGGPKKVDMWPVDARHTLERQANGQHPHERFVKHLPKGMKPGKAQLEAEERAVAEAEARQRDMDRDPHFGQQPQTIQ